MKKKEVDLAYLDHWIACIMNRRIAPLHGQVNFFKKIILKPSFKEIFLFMIYGYDRFFWYFMDKQ
jgi:hypothetical protein